MAMILAVPSTAGPANRTAPSHVAEVDALISTATTVGITGGGGNVTPGAQVPFGFVSLGPDTSRGYSTGYDGASLN